MTQIFLPKILRPNQFTDTQMRTRIKSKTPWADPEIWDSSYGRTILQTAIFTDLYKPDLPGWYVKFDNKGFPLNIVSVKEVNGELMAFTSVKFPPQKVSDMGATSRSYTGPFAMPNQAASYREWMSMQIQASKEAAGATSTD